MFKKALPFVVASIFAMPAAFSQTYSTSWFGNSYPGGDPQTQYKPSSKWIQGNITGMAVGPNGTVYASSTYDEDHRTVGIYLNGDLAPVKSTDGNYAAMDDLAGAGKYPTSGIAVDPDGTHIWLAASFNGCSNGSKANGPTTPGEIWQGIRRFDTSGNIAPYTTVRGVTAGGDDGSWIVISDTKPTNSIACPSSASDPQFTYSTFGDNILGLAVDGSNIYLVDGETTIGSSTVNTIRTFTKPTGTTPVSGLIPSEHTKIGISNSSYPGVVTGMAVGSTGTLWVTIGKEGLLTGSGTARLLKVTGTTVANSGATGLSDPNAVAMDNSGNVMVADNGTNQQILFYAASGTGAPTKTFGVKGGILINGGASTNSQSFQGLVGVGMDSQGNLLVGMNGIGKQQVYPAFTNPLNSTKGAPRPQTGGGTSQTQIREFSPSGSSWSALTSQIQSETYEITGDVDPSNDTNIYTSQRVFNFNYPSSNPFFPVWNQTALTLDYVTYPDDPRIWDAYNFPSPTMRRINGELFMYATSATPGQMAIWKFHGNIAVPSNFISYESHTDTASDFHPIGHPTNGSQFYPYTWIDSANDGQFEDGTYTTSTTTFSSGHAIAWDVDATGNVWMALGGASSTGDSIYEFPITQSGGKPVIDSNGNLELATWKTAVGYKIPTYDSSKPDPTPKTGSHLSAFQAMCPPPATPITRTQCPGDLCTVERMNYQGGASDVMILTGFSLADNNLGFKTGCGSPNSVGPTIVRYNNWTTSPTVSWKQSIQYDVWTDQSYTWSTPASMDAAGPYLFISYTNEATDQTSNAAAPDGTTIVLDVSDNGDPVPSMTITRGSNNANVGFGGGILDIPYGTHVHKRTNGSYALIEEEDTQEKLTVSMIPVVSDTTEFTTFTALKVGSAVNENTSVTFTATVTNQYPLFQPYSPIDSDAPPAPTPPPTPTGSVTFYDGGTSLGSETVNGSGVATYTFKSGTSGNHVITATFTPSGSYLGSNAPAQIQVVNP